MKVNSTFNEGLSLKKWRMFWTCLSKKIVWLVRTIVGESKKIQFDWIVVLVELVDEVQLWMLKDIGGLG